MKVLKTIGFFTLVLILPFLGFVYSPGSTNHPPQGPSHEEKQEMKQKRPIFPRRFYIAYNEKNRQLIDGPWEIQGSTVSLALVGISTIEMNQDLTFWVSHYDENGSVQSLLLFRQNKDGAVEVIRAFKLLDKPSNPSKPSKSSTTTTLATLSSKTKTEESTPLREIDFVLSSVRNIPKSLSKNLEGHIERHRFFSTIRITDHHVDELTIAYGEEEILYMNRAKREGNKFIGMAYEYGKANPVIGFLMKTGQDAYKVRIATGEFSGMELDIVSEQKAIMMAEREEEEVEVVASERVIREQERASLLRQEVNRQLVQGDIDMDEDEVVEELSSMDYEELKERAQDIRFNF